MVFVNSQKFACESCIKGHRSSSCHHTDRPLFEIKKKGRPVTQCERCRELRKNKHMHVKCTCADATSAQSNNDLIELHDEFRPTLRRPGQRKIPTTPTLPNGLRDLVSQYVSNPSEDMHPKQRVDALLNPCNCKSLWKCRCPDRYGKRHKSTVSLEKDNDPLDPSIASPSKSRCGGSNIEDSSLDSGRITLHGTKVPTPTAFSHREERRFLSIPYTPSSYTPHNPFNAPRPNEKSDSPFELALPPLKRSKIGGSDIDKTSPLPSLTDVYPSTQDAIDQNALAVASLTRCGCGSTCTCPGCKEHRGKDLAAQSGEDCPDKCGSCIDHMGGIALPTPSSITLTANTSSSHVVGSHSCSGTQGNNAGMSTLDHFYAIAALLPPPPQSRVHGPGMLDPTNVAVYQQTSGRKQDWRKGAGLIQLPPLNCCDGKCKCPGGMCGCGTECGGRCGSHGINVANADETAAVDFDTEITGKEIGEITATAGCCAGRNANTGRAGTSSRKILRL